MTQRTSEGPPMVRLGDYWVSADRRLWYDGSRWRPVEWRSERLLIGGLVALEVAVVAMTLVVLVPTAWQFNCQFSSYAKTHYCGVMNDYWMTWVAGYGIGVVVNAAVIVGAVLLVRWYRRTFTMPMPLLKLLRTTASKR